MPIKSSKRKVAGPSPWERGAKEGFCTPDRLNFARDPSLKRPKFSLYGENMYSDIYTKRAALRTSPSVVSLVSYIGEEEIFQCSGTIIESDDVSSVILTAANLIRCLPGRTFAPDDIKVVAHLSGSRLFEGQILAFDFHYNIAAIKIQSDAPLPTACLRDLDDSITIDPSQLHIPKERPFQLRPHSRSYNLIPGDRVIALGRYFEKPHDIMAAPGEFSLDRCENEYECKELFRVNGFITRCGTGGPLINLNGEVIGICFYGDGAIIPFLPINLVSKWWNHSKKNGEPRRPYLGMQATNLYGANLDVMEEIIQKFPNAFKGVIVEKIIPGSFADSAGINPNDVIVKFGGKTIRGFLKLLEAMWDKVGDSVELVVLRARDGVRMHLSMVVEEATPDKFYSWPLCDYKYI